MTSQWWRAKDTVFLTLAVLLFLAFAFGLIVGVAYLAGYPYYDPGVLPLMALVCTPTALVPALILAWLGVAARRRERSLVEFSAWVKTYRRVAMRDLAAKLGKSAFEAEKLLVEVVDRGLVRGFIDRATDEFVLHEAVGQEAFVQSCPQCGANLQRRYLLGETVRCPYCQSVAVAPPPGGSS